MLETAVRIWQQDGVVVSEDRTVVGSIFLSADEHFGVEKLAVFAGTDFIDGLRDS